MVSTITLITIIAWLPQVIFELLNFVYWLQVKEYRIDRFRAFIFSREGLDKLSLPTLFVKLFCLTAVLYFPNLSIFLLPVFIYLDIRYLQHYFNKELRKPQFTTRAKRIIFTSATGVLISLIGFS